MTCTSPFAWAKAVNIAFTRMLIRNSMPAKYLSGRYKPNRGPYAVKVLARVYSAYGVARTARRTTWKMEKDRKPDIPRKSITESKIDNQESFSVH